MSHDIEAAYASSEIANLILSNQENFFGSYGAKGEWSIYVGCESDRQWPLTDGVILAENPKYDGSIKIAFEYKRPNEGIHGILTALGQSFAYLEKGYDASIMVIPDSYTSHLTPGEHVNRIIDATSPKAPISIYTYTTPDLSSIRPFQDKLQCMRSIDISSYTPVIKTEPKTKTIGNVRTLWAHMREGMSHPDAFFRFCQSVKIATVQDTDMLTIDLPDALLKAIYSIDSNIDPYKYLSYTTGDTISDRAWRYVWFKYYFWQDLIPIWSAHKPYIVNSKQTKIYINNSNTQSLFAGRTDSIKARLVKQLNSNSIKEDEAWIEYAKNVRNNAHSYREVIDSGLYHIGYINSDSTLTEIGYKFVNACERYGSPYNSVPMQIFKASILQNGQYGALLHYIDKVSAEKFHEDLFAFSVNEQGSYVFKHKEYLSYLDKYFAETLHISRKSSSRAEGTRMPFQAELALLKKMGFVRTKGDKIAYRIGVGLEIDWEQVQHSMLFFQNI